MSCNRRVPGSIPSPCRGRVEASCRRTPNLHLAPETHPSPSKEPLTLRGSSFLAPQKPVRLINKVFLEPTNTITSYFRYTSFICSHASKSSLYEIEIYDMGTCPQTGGESPQCLHRLTSPQHEEDLVPSLPSSSPPPLLPLARHRPLTAGPVKKRPSSGWRDEFKTFRTVAHRDLTPRNKHTAVHTRSRHLRTGLDNLKYWKYEVSQTGTSR